MTRAELVAKRDAAVAALTAAELTRNELLECREIEAQIKAAERRLATLQKITDFEKDYGPLGEGFGVVSTPAGDVFVRCPEPSVFRAYIDKSGTSAEVLEQFVRRCVLPPTEAAKEDFGRVIAELPGVLWSAENVATALARRGVEILSKK